MVASEGTSSVTRSRNGTGRLRRRRADSARSAEHHCGTWPVPAPPPVLRHSLRRTRGATHRCPRRVTTTRRQGTTAPNTPAASRPASTLRNDNETTTGCPVCATPFTLVRHQRRCTPAFVSALAVFGGVRVAFRPEPGWSAGPTSVCGLKSGDDEGAGWAAMVRMSAHPRNRNTVTKQKQPPAARPPGAPATPTRQAGPPSCPPRRGRLPVPHLRHPYPRPVVVPRRQPPSRFASTSAGCAHTANEPIAISDIAACASREPHAADRHKPDRQ